eukprot:CAMPEP_0194340258 /NCGR_PEP_ID=MMETSP0171-20130528/85686_1 /TAXON_ID=218684 /ORGANISM="Corethron pennatum, Strain L29A3" /LENGTH=39 /DNA_ID= /DNA_START= /DNA_END= /DNA_ORIENTATION=
MTPDAIELVHEDVAYQVDANFAEVVFWNGIKDDTPTPPI